MTLSPLLGGSCRFEPSCSDYALQSFKLHSPRIALRLTLQRIWRCRPGGAFGEDPVPLKLRKDHCCE